MLPKLSFGIVKEMKTMLSRRLGWGLEMFGRKTSSITSGYVCGFSFFICLHEFWTIICLPEFSMMNVRLLCRVWISQLTSSSHWFANKKLLLKPMLMWKPLINILLECCWPSFTIFGCVSGIYTWNEIWCTLTTPRA